MERNSQIVFVSNPVVQQIPGVVHEEEPRRAPR